MPGDRLRHPGTPRAMTGKAVPPRPQFAKKFPQNDLEGKIFRFYLPEALSREIIYP